MATFLKFFALKYVRSIKVTDKTMLMMIKRITDMKYRRVYQLILSHSMHSSKNYLTNADKNEYKNRVVNDQLNYMNNCMWTYGFISIQKYQRALQVVNSTEHLTKPQALILIRCCGESMIEKSAKMREKFAEDAWKTMKHLGIAADISHYNALLQVYLSCRSNFSPLDFLTEMDKENVKPNRTTYESLIEACCIKGDIQTAQQILNLVKDNDFPVTENVYRSLITGYAVSGNMKEVYNILSIIKLNGVKFSASTYASLICAYAKSADIENIRKILSECDEKNIWFSSDDLAAILCAMVVNERMEYIDEFLPRFSRGNVNYGKKIMETIHQQFEAGREDIAFRVLEITLQLYDSKMGGSKNEFYNSFIRMAVYNNLPVEKVLKLCQIMEENKLCCSAYTTALNIYLKTRAYEQFLILSKRYKKCNGNIREHFFYPILVSYAKDGNVEGITNILEIMLDDYQLSPNKYPISEFMYMHLSHDKRHFLQQIEKYYKKNTPSDTISYYPRAHKKSLAYYCVKNRLRNEEIYKLFKENNCHIDYNVCWLLINMYSELHDVKSFRYWLNKLQTIQPFIEKEKILKLVITFVENGFLQDALDCFNMTSQDIMHLKRPCQHLSEELMIVLEKTGNIELTDKIFNKLVQNDYFIYPTHKLLAPLLTVRIKNGNIENALDKFESICHEFNYAPLRLTFMRQFVRNGNTEALDRVMNVCKSIVFDKKQFVDLAMILIECKNEQIARKTLQKVSTSNILSNTMDRFLIFAQFYNNTGQITHLENMVNHLRNLVLPSIMESMCTMLMINYEFANEYQKGLALWIQMQEDNVQPDNLFLSSLSRLLKKNNIKQPFVFNTDDLVSEPSSVENRKESIKNNNNVLDTSNSTMYSASKSNAFLYSELLANKYASIPKLQDEYDTNIYIPDYNKIFTVDVKTKRTNKYNKVDIIKNYLEIKGDTEFYNAIDNMLQEPNGELHQMDKYMPNDKWIKCLQENPRLIQRFELFAVKCFENNLINPICILWLYYFTEQNAKETEIWENYIKNIKNNVYYRNAIRLCKLKDDITLFPALALKIDEANLYINIKQKAYTELMSAILCHDDLRKYECALECLKIALRKLSIHEFKRIIDEINDGYKLLGKPRPKLFLAT